MNTDDILLDEQTGISIEEQKEILSRINGITEKNRSSLSNNGKPRLKAKKRGILFPLAVNIASVLILCAGVFFIIWFNRQTDEQNRTGTAVYNLTERALIEEIRRDTSEKIAAKEREIKLIASRLEEADAQLDAFIKEFISSGGNLSAEQLAVQENLLALRISIRSELAVLQDERAGILEESRAKEAYLRAQIEERSREFAPQRKTPGEQDAAGAELARLSGLQEKIDSLEALIAHIQINGADQSAGLQTRNIQLENTIADMQKEIDALSEGNESQSRRFSELDESVRTLRSERNSLSQTVTTRDNRIRELESQNTSQSQEISNLRNQLDIIRQALQE
ncbi:MAG: hypothetical protein FWC19_03845 [Treponema sp.]|nr:hypothetical protein [Treponema sp.]MCL2271923.1 hypothetical protein [Treponema sp.]